MSLIKSLLPALLCMLTALSFADPGRVQISWSNPDNYKDIRAAGGESEQAFRQRLAGSIQSYMDRLAVDLPENSSLEMNFTNLTLAGDVRISGASGGHKEVRVVKDGYRARISLDYKLLDAAGLPLKQGKEDLKSPLSSTRISRTSRNEAFEIEKKMLARWFNKTLIN